MNEIFLKDNIKMDEELIKNFSINGNQESLEKLLSTLKFLSKIREGEKIDVKNMSIVKPDIPSRIYRTVVSRETKMDTYYFLKTSLSNAIELIYYYLSEGSKNSKKEYSIGSGMPDNEGYLSTSPQSREQSSSKEYSSGKEDDGIEQPRPVEIKKIVQESNIERFNKEIAKTIIDNLENAYKGIKNLSLTYGEDRKFTTDLESLIETSNLKINKAKKYFY